LISQAGSIPCCPNFPHPFSPHAGREGQQGTSNARYELIIKSERDTRGHYPIEFFCALCSEFFLFPNNSLTTQIADQNKSGCHSCRLWDPSFQDRRKMLMDEGGLVLRLGQFQEGRSAVVME
jgi:hypothetical protein